MQSAVYTVYTMMSVTAAVLADRRDQSRRGQRKSARSRPAVCHPVVISDSNHLETV